MNQWIRYPILAYAAVFGTLGGHGIAMADDGVVADDVAADSMAADGVAADSMATDSIADDTAVDAAADSGVVSVATTAVASAGRVTSTCPPDVCGRNSAELEAYPLEELDLDGKEVSRGGFRITDVALTNGHNFTIPDPQIKLDVIEGVLVATHSLKWKGKPQRVKGLVVQHAHGSYAIHFVEARFVRSWARRAGCDHSDPATIRNLECYETAYVVEYKALPSTGSTGVSSGLDKGKGKQVIDPKKGFDPDKPIKGKPTLCTEVPSWGNEQASFIPPETLKESIGYRNTERWSSPTASALLVKGEIYDYETATVVEPTPPGRWFNIACAGSAIGKMKLMGYDPAPLKSAWKTKAWQRQATLKMITASYCEAASHEQFTQTGQRLAFQNRAEWFDPWSRVVYDDSQVEAFWGAKGATCLNLPRSSRWRVDLKWIRKKCGLSPCRPLFTPSRAGSGSTALDARRAFEADGGVLGKKEEWATFNRIP